MADTDGGQIKSSYFKKKKKQKKSVEKKIKIDMRTLSEKNDYL